MLIAETPGIDFVITPARFIRQETIPAEARGNLFHKSGVVPEYAVFDCMLCGIDSRRGTVKDGGENQNLTIGGRKASRIPLLHSYDKATFQQQMRAPTFEHRMRVV